MEYRKLGGTGLVVSELALGAMLANPHVTAALIGANSVEQLQDNLAGPGLRLAEERQLLDGLSDGRET